MRFSGVTTPLILLCILPTLSFAFRWKCAACRGAVTMLRLFYERNATANEIEIAAKFFCRRFAHVDSFICDGITSQFKEEFLYVLGQLVFRPSQLCGLLVHGCGTPYGPFDTNWTVPLPPKPTSALPRLRSSEFSPPLRILQLSDLHFDMDYQEGAEAECGRPLCCVNRTKEPVKKPAGKWGTLASCDIPLRTVENLLAHINTTHMVDMILLSGDYMSHKDWAYSRTRHRAAIENLTTLIATYLPAVPVFWTLGNHEGVPVNSFAPHFVPRRFQPHWMYRAILEAGKRTAALPSSVEQSAEYRGSYMVQLRPRLRLISLNNGYCEKTNFFIYINQTDPDGSLTWLVEQLWAAEQANNYVYILAHIPPGNGECLESWSRNYYRIVTRFSETIAAQFFGHTHTDSFSIFYEDMNDPHSRPLSVLFTAPSVTTFERLNPAYRIYSADMHTGKLLDYETYFFNLTASHENESPKWEFLYRAKEEYELSDLSATEWNSLADRIESNSTVAQKFNRNYVRQDTETCTGDCLTHRLCEIRAAHHNEKALCGKNERKSNRTIQKKQQNF